MTTVRGPVNLLQCNTLQREIDGMSEMLTCHSRCFYGNRLEDAANAIGERQFLAMTDRSDNGASDIVRALEALARIENADLPAAMRRTDAEPAPDAAAAALSEENARLKAENESLRQKLAGINSGEDNSIRRDAAMLARRVDRALEQLDLIEKG